MRWLDSTLGGVLTAHPIAAVSSAAFYAVLVALAFRPARRLLASRIGPAAGRQPHVAAFDSVRGLAAALVAIGHCWHYTYPVFRLSQEAAPFLEYGQKAVPIFCVLSGFLIYRSALAIGSLESLRAYAVRRFFRIYPVYAVGVLLGAAFLQYAASPDSPGVSAPARVVADLLMLRILWWPGFANPVTWSLYFEVMFYAALPLAVIVLGRRRMLAFALLGIAGMLVADYPSRDFGLWKYFLMGIVASEISPRLRTAAAPLFVLGLGFVVLDFTGPAGDWVARLGLVPPRMDGQTFGLGLGCLLVLATLPQLSRLSRALSVPPLRLLGAISYSVYILHPFYILASFPDAGVLVFGQNTSAFAAMPVMPSWYLPLVFLPGVFFWGLVSFVLVERPGIRLGRRLAGGPRTAPALRAAQDLA